MAPVAHALAARGLAPRLVLTGQHPDLDLREHKLASFECLALRCPGERDPHRHVGSVTAALLPKLRERPSLIVVQGDTSSALGAALAANTSEVPLAHVEAGLRTHDPKRPWPEEEYRTAIDAGAELLFAPTAAAADNLRREGVPGRIEVTGNTGIDAVLAAAATLPSPRLHDGAARRILVTTHRRESWGDALRSIASAVADLARSGANLDVVLPPNGFVADSIRRLLGGTPNVSFLPPCTHAELLRRMRQSDLLLSDSGGMQEEAPALGVPLLVLRDETERPEAIATGNSRLVGTDGKRIVAEALRLLADPAALAAMSRPSFPFGDGRAGPRIAAIIEEWLEEQPSDAVTSARSAPGTPARW